MLVLHVCKRAGNPENLVMTVYVPPQKKKKKIGGWKKSEWLEGRAFPFALGGKET